MGCPAFALLGPSPLKTGLMMTVLTTLVEAARRAVGLHGDAVGNAAASVRRDDQARGDRERIAADIAAYPTDAAETTEADANRTAQ